MYFSFVHLINITELFFLLLTEVILLSGGSPYLLEQKHHVRSEFQNSRAGLWELLGAFLWAGLAQELRRSCSGPCLQSPRPGDRLDLVFLNHSSAEQCCYWSHTLWRWVCLWNPWLLENMLLVSSEIGLLISFPRAVLDFIASCLPTRNHWISVSPVVWAGVLAAI